MKNERTINIYILSGEICVSKLLRRMKSNNSKPLVSKMALPGNVKVVNQ